MGAGHRLLLERHWPQVLSSVDADLRWRAALVARGGIGAALASLYPGSTWHGRTLQVPYARDVDLRPAAQGLTLMPSPFWTGQPLIGRDDRGGDLLVYPALTPLPLVPADPPGDHLEALLGPTRAAVLRAAGHRTTGELARELGTSLASVSQHTRTLRESGLLTSTREGRHVRHDRTPLGTALCRGVAAALPAQPDPLPP